MTPREASGLGFETRAIHAGQDPDPTTGAVVVPMSLATTFAQESVGVHQRLRVLAVGQPDPHRARGVRGVARSRPSHGLAFASGLAAEDTVLRCLAAARGGRVLLGNDAYGGTYRLIAKVWSPLGVEWSAVDLTDVDALAAAWPDDTTRGLVGDADQPAADVHRHRGGGARSPTTAARSVVVDNTFATPYLQQPLDARRRRRRALGHEVPRRPQRRRRRVRRRRTTTRSPSSCASCRTPPARCRRRSTATSCCAASRRSACAWIGTARNARAIVDLLVRHPRVERVYYPQLPDHPGHAAAAKQMSDFGGMVSFTVAAGAERGQAGRRGRPQLFTLAESLGAVESLIEHPGAMTHASAAGSPLEVPDNLVRLSVGIESRPTSSPTSSRP